MRETRVRSLAWEYPLGKETETTPVFLPGKFHGQRSLVGYSPWGCKESDVTVRLTETDIYVHTHTHIDMYTHWNIAQQ